MSHEKICSMVMAGAAMLLVACTNGSRPQKVSPPIPLPSPIPEAPRPYDQGGTGRGFLNEDGSGDVKHGARVSRFRFGDHLEMAHLRSGGLLIDFGTPARHKHTLGDWHSGFFGDFAVKESTYSYLTGRTGRLFFHAFDAEKGGGTISFRARAEGSTKARIYLNDAYVGSLVLLPSEFSHAMVSFEKGILPGRNEIRIQCNTRKRSTDGPSAALALDYVRITSHQETEGPAAAAFDAVQYKGGASGVSDIALTEGESVTYYLPIPKNVRIEAEVMAQTAGQSGSLSVIVRSDKRQGAPAADRPVQDKPVHLEVDLDDLAGESAEITFLATKGEVLLRDAALTALSQSPDKAPGKRQAKNVILVLIDTLRADKIDLYNKETPVRSPFVSGLGESAMVFGRALAPENWTKPSVASLLTGLYPSTHKTKGDRDQLPTTATMIPEHLQSLGFTTAGFIANGYVSDKFGFKRGWDTWTNYVREGKANRAELVVADAIKWLEAQAKRGDKPFFLYVHTIDPHVPYIPPNKYLKMYDGGAYKGPVEGRETAEIATKIKTGHMKLSDRDKMRFEALYDGEITYHDDQLIHLPEKLEALDLLDDTLLVVTSDHGEEFFDHGSVGHGHSLYEELLHVPLLIRLPGGRATSQARDIHEVSLVDIFPTACEALGVECPKGMEGHSLLPLLEGKAWPLFPSAAFSEFLEHQRAARMGRYKLILRGPAITLFDLAHDPDETEDLSGERPIALTMLLDAMGSHLGGFIETPTSSGKTEKRQRHEPTKATIDEETRRQLRALGYLGDDK